MEELVKMLLEDRVIVKAPDGAWYVEAGRLDNVRVPPSLAGLLQARLDTLLYPERLTLQRAAVIGRVFYDAALQALDAADEPREQLADLLGILQRLTERGFIQRRETSAMAGSEEYVFAQAMLHDQIYATLLRRQVSTYHAALAGWLAASERADEYLPLIAGHYEKAGDVAKAAHFLRRAGQQALARGTPKEALSFCERALALLPAPLPSGDVLMGERIELLLALGETKRGLGQYAESQADFQTALGLARQANDRRQVALALYYLGWTVTMQGDFAAAQAYLTESLPLARALAESGVDRATLAQVLYGLGRLAWSLSQLDEAATLFEEGLALARALGDQTLELHALNGLGLISLSLKRSAEARARWDEGRALAAQRGNRVRLAVFLNNLGEVDRGEGKYREAGERYQEALALSREVGDRHNEVFLLLNLGLLAMALGEVAEAEEHFRAGIRQAWEFGTLPLSLWAVADLGWVRARAGDSRTALAWLGLALSHPAADANVRDAADPVLAELRAVLSPEEIEAGLARGQTLTLEEVVQELLREGK